MKKDSKKTKNGKKISKKKLWGIVFNFPVLYLFLKTILKLILNSLFHYHNFFLSYKKNINENSEFLFLIWNLFEHIK